MSVTSNPTGPFNSTNGSATQTFPVTLSVNGFGPWSLTLSGDNMAPPPPSIITTDPTSLTFDVVTGQATPPPSKTFKIVCAAGVAWNTHDSGPWDLSGATFNGTDGLKGTGPTTITLKPSGDMVKLTATQTFDISVVSGNATAKLSVKVNVTTGTTTPPPSGGNLPIMSTIAKWAVPPGNGIGLAAVAADNINGVAFAEFSTDSGAWQKVTTEVVGQLCPQPLWYCPAFPSTVKKVEVRFTDGKGGVSSIPPLDRTATIVVVTNPTRATLAAAMSDVNAKVWAKGDPLSKTKIIGGGMTDGFFDNCRFRLWITDCDISQFNNGPRSAILIRNCNIHDVASDAMSDSLTCINNVVSNLNMAQSPTEHGDVNQPYANRAGNLIYGLTATQNIHAQGIDAGEPSDGYAWRQVNIVVQNGNGGARCYTVGTIDGPVSNGIVRDCVFDGINTHNGTITNWRLVNVKFVGSNPTPYSGVTVG